MKKFFLFLVLISIIGCSIEVKTKSQSKPLLYKITLYSKEGNEIRVFQASSFWTYENRLTFWDGDNNQFELSGQYLIEPLKEN